MHEVCAGVCGPPLHGRWHAGAARSGRSCHPRARRSHRARPATGGRTSGKCQREANSTLNIYALAAVALNLTACLPALLWCDIRRFEHWIQERSSFSARTAFVCMVISLAQCNRRRECAMHWLHLALSYALCLSCLIDDFREC
jgi:hypothetical protein